MVLYVHFRRADEADIAQTMQASSNPIYDDGGFSTQSLTTAQE